MSESDILSRIISFVPPYWVRQAWADPTHPLIGRESRIYAAVLFVDISGFTPITEALSGKGREGIEELSALLDRYFTVMAEPVMALGGEVVKFAGDALIVTFPAQADGQDTHLGAALNCALRMQEAMVQFKQVRTSVGEFPLRMKIGIGEGAIYNTTVGDEGKGMQPVFAGRPLARCQQAEDRATAGEIVIDAALLRRIPGSLDIGEARDTFRPILGATNVPALPPIAQPDLSALSPEQTPLLIQRLSPYLPFQLVERMKRGQRGTFGEHRRVTVMFVKFGGLNYDWEPQVGEALQIYFTAMQDCILRYGGRLNEVDIDSNGGILVVFFGAPTAHEDDEMRAISCAWEMQQAVADVRVRAGSAASRLLQRIGVSSGALFVGDVGAPIRRTYATVGDEVNLAARLMNLAQWGEVVVTRWVQRRAAGRFEFEAMGNVKVKGKAESVPLFALLAPRWDADESGAWSNIVVRRPLVGRVREQATIQAIQEQAWQKQPQCLIISGEAGVGKSHLVGELVREWSGRGGNALFGDCQQRADRQDLASWIDLVRTALGLRQDEWLERQQEKVSSQLTFLSPHLSSLEPIFVSMLGLSPEQPVGTGSELSPAACQQVLTEFFQTLAARQPLLLVLENIHQADTASLGLWEYLLRHSQDMALLICVTSRSTSGQSWDQVTVPITHLPLSGLTAQEALELSGLLLQNAGLPAGLAVPLAEQAQGNPLFLQEMVSAMAEAQSRGESPDLSTVIPESIAEMIQAQVDRLDEDAKQTLRLAAVVGLKFEAEVLGAAHPLPLSQTDLQTRLDVLMQARLIVAETPTRYRFVQAMACQVIYNRLLSTHRELFHRLVGAAIQQVYADRLVDHFESLADHFYRGDDLSRSIHWLIQAGQRAAQLENWSAAAAHYTHALRVLDEYEQSGNSGRAACQTRMQILVERGDVYHQTFQLAAALSDYEAVTQLAGSLADLRTQGYAMLQIGRIDLGQARYLDAWLAAHQAMQRFAALDESVSIIHTRQLVGQIYLLQGQLRQARHYVQHAIAAAQEIERSADLVCGQTWLGLIEHLTGQMNQALDTLQRAAELGHKLALPVTITAGAVQRLAELLLFLGRWGQAIQLALESLQLAQSGNQLDSAQARHVMGLVLTQVGAAQQAYEHLEQVVEFTAQVGWHAELAPSLCAAGEALLATGDYDRARHCFERSLALGQQSNTVRAIIEARLGLSKLAAVDKNWAEEQRLCNEARAMARRANIEPLVVAARIGLARAYLGHRDWRAAQREASLARARSYVLRCPYNVLRAEAMLGEAWVGLGDQERARLHFREAQSIILRLADTLPEPYKRDFMSRPYLRTVQNYALD